MCYNFYSLQSLIIRTVTLNWFELVMYTYGNPVMLGDGVVEEIVA